MDFSLLPSDIIEEVAKYLSLEEIITCSMVNTQWRRAFDTDRIWKRCSTFHPNYFNKQVTNRRNSSKYFFGGCKSKKRVFRELQVGKNLVHGKYEVARVDKGRIYCDNLLDVVDIVGNHWLFLSCASNCAFKSFHLIEVWNMNDKPIIHQAKQTSLALIGRLYDTQMKVINNKLFYLASNTLLAFEFSCPTYYLTALYRVICPHNASYIERPYSRTAMVCKPNMDLGFVYKSAHAERSAVPWVHVWNEGVFSYMNYSIREVNEMENENARHRITLEVKDGDGTDNVLLVYQFCKRGQKNFSAVLFNTITYKYTTLLDQTNVQSIFCDLVNEVVVLFYYQLQEGEVSLRGCCAAKLICYSTNGTLIYETELRWNSSCPHYHILTANEGKEVLALDSCGKVTVFDVFQQKEISTFKVTSGDNFVTFIKDSLVIIQKQRRKKTVQEIWDFKSGKRLYEFVELKSISPDSGIYRYSFTKDYRSPPKIFAIQEPLHYYSKPSNGEIVVISFL